MRYKHYWFSEVEAGRMPPSENFPPKVQSVPIKDQSYKDQSDTLESTLTKWGNRANPALHAAAAFFYALSTQARSCTCNKGVNPYHNHDCNHHKAWLQSVAIAKG